MKAFFDTSVLVPVFYEDHQHHEASLDLFLRFRRQEACCGAHSLAEVYSTLTRMPGKHRVTPDQAMLFVENILERLTVVALTSEEYASGLRSWALTGVAGGTVYDALLASCALKAKAERIYSWNVRHYEQLGASVQGRLQEPGGPRKHSVAE